MRAIHITRQLSAPDPNGIALSQTLSFQAGTVADADLNGALVVDGVAVLDQPRQIRLAAANDFGSTNTTFVVIGTDGSGNQVSEDITPTLGNVEVTTVRNDWKTINRVLVGGLAVQLIIGTVEEGASAPIPLDQNISPPFNISLSVAIEGVVDVTLQYTYDSIFDNVGPYTWFDHPDFTAITVSAEGSQQVPISAVRLLTNSGLGSARLTVRQIGLI